MTTVINTDLKKLIVANNNLGFRLLSWLINYDPNKNVFISSFSVVTALAMAYNGAEGKTQEVLAELLGLKDIPLQHLNELNASFISMIMSLDPKTQLAVANSIWLRAGSKLSPDFTQRIKSYYSGEAADLDFGNPQAADIINNWVASKTHEKIQGLVTPSTISAAILILINAIYFKGSWANQFDKGKTAERDFHTFDGSHNQCLMMFQSGDYTYHETDEFQAVSLRYGEGRLRMYIFLPKPKYSINDFQKILTAPNWQEWMSRFDVAKGKIAIPRFRIEYGQDLLACLKDLGGNEIAGVDFTAMGAGPLRISNVIHKTYIEVNEEGTEAAAATAVLMFRGMPPDKSFTMIVDRPFFAAIVDNFSGAILFTGFVLDPTNE